MIIAIEYKQLTNRTNSIILLTTELPCHNRSCFLREKGEGLIIPQNPYSDLDFFLRIKYPKPTNSAMHTIRSENMIVKPAPNIPMSVTPNTINARMTAQITRNRNILILSLFV